MRRWERDDGCFFFLSYEPSRSLSDPLTLSLSSTNGQALSNAPETLACKAGRRKRSSRSQAARELGVNSTQKATRSRRRRRRRQLHCIATPNRISFCASCVRSPFIAQRNGPAQRASRGRRPPPGRPWLLKEVGFGKRERGGEEEEKSSSRKKEGERVKERKKESEQASRKKSSHPPPQKKIVVEEEEFVFSCVLVPRPLWCSFLAPPSREHLSHGARAAKNQRKRSREVEKQGGKKNK